MVSGLAGAVLGVAEGVGLSSDTVARYGKCCEAVEEFVACQQERARHDEIGPNRRNALVKSTRLMLEFQGGRQGAHGGQGLRDAWCLYARVTGISLVA